MVTRLTNRESPHHQANKKQRLKPASSNVTSMAECTNTPPGACLRLFEIIRDTIFTFLDS